VQRAKNKFWVGQGFEPVTALTGLKNFCWAGQSSSKGKMLDEGSLVIYT
jgi:hypothetical protein